MASGFFGVAGPRDLEPGVAPGADNGVERVIVDVQLIALFDPLAQRLIGGQAHRPPEGLLQAGQDVRGQGHGLPSRHVHVQQRRQAACFIDRKPVADGMAMDAPQLGNALAGLRLSAGQSREPLQAWCLATVMCMWQPLLEGSRTLGDDREGLAPRLLSCKTAPMGPSTAPIYAQYST
jgi:hypothetical protein